MKPPPVALSRRTALGGLGTIALVPLLAACSGGLDDRVTDPLGAGVDRLRAPRITPPAPPSPDQPIVDAVVSAIAGLRATVGPYRQRDPLFADLAALHRSHLVALGAPHARGTAVTLAAADQAGQVRAHEQQLAARIAEKAVAARDPQLARLLASMAAAISQRTTGAAA